MNISPASPLIVWRLLDGKPGHENQSLGLVNALKRKIPCRVFDIPVQRHLPSIRSFFSSLWPQGEGLPLPNFIIGAGHRTYLHLLAAKRAFGGRTIALMKPSLPVPMFDLCIIPQHDEYQGKGTYIETRGVLNTITAGGQHLPDKALIMIGGPSKHFDWDEVGIRQQLQQLISDNSNVNYTLTTSRRTPAGFVSTLKQTQYPNLNVIPAEDTAPGWVAQQLADCATAWISEDSVSMVYEALTAQVAVGLLNMPMRGESRISRGIAQLNSQKLVSRFDPQGHYRQTLKPIIGFMEADRCSDWLVNNWISPNATSDGGATTITA